MAKISDSEMDVMEVVWQSGDFVNVNEVFEKMPDSRKWKYNTVATFMLRLSEKGFLEHRKNGWTNEYSPLITKDEYKKHETESFLKSVHEGSKKSMIAALYQDEMTGEELDELLKWLDRG